MVQFNNSNDAMETIDHFKKETSSKNQISKGNCLKIICFTILAMLISVTLVTCAKDDSGSGNGGSEIIDNNVYALDISEETEWDYMIVGEDKSLLFTKLDENSSIPLYLTFSYDGDMNNAFTITFKENGLPDLAYINEYILVFDNFREHLFDLAIINSDDTISYFYGIESDSINWDEIVELGGKTANVKDGGLIKLEHSLKFISTSLSAVTCVIAVSTAFATVGIAIPLAVVSCGTFVGGAFSSYYHFNSSNFGVGLSITSAVVSKINTLVGCVQTAGITCYLSLTSDYLGEYSIALEVYNQKQYKIVEAQGVLSGTTVTGLPTVTTTLASNITNTTATCGGNVTSDGGAAVTERGVCWSIFLNPTIANNQTFDGSGTGEFTSSITGLTANTTYYVRAYAINSNGIAYGFQTVFTTAFSGNTVTDADGNVYGTVTIGTQTWMAENLKTTKYNDGTPIPNVTDDSWAALSTPAYCWYNNDATQGYGALYNWYAVNTGKLCPTGWHVPSLAEYHVLQNYLKTQGYQIGIPGGNDAIPLKATFGWDMYEGESGNGTDVCDFSALPGGHRGGAFGDCGICGGWWCSTEYDTDEARGMEMTYNHDFVLWGLYRPKNYGYSVRCLRD